MTTETPILPGDKVTPAALKTFTRPLPAELARLRDAMLSAGWSAEYRPVPDPEAERGYARERADYDKEG